MFNLLDLLDVLEVLELLDLLNAALSHRHTAQPGEAPHPMNSFSTMSATSTMTDGTHDFHVCLDHLTSLRRALADLETALGAAHAHHWPTIDPTLHTGPAAWRVEKDDSATYVYGLLNEASPLGDTHADVVRRLQDWYHRIHEMVTAMTTYADRTRAQYAAADEAVAAAAMRAAEGLGGGGGFGGRGPDAAGGLGAGTP